MDKVYAILIRDTDRVLKDVPKRIRDRVRVELKNMGLDEKGFPLTSK